jgi:hypothetical protein
MDKKKKVFLILGSAVVITGVILFFIKPKAKISLRQDGSGIIQLGSSKKEFKVGASADLTSWNGYELHGSGEKLWFRKWGRDLVKADGSPNVEIVVI